MKAKVISELEEKALLLGLDVFAAAPKQYMDRPEVDALGQAWQDAIATTMSASIALETLGDLLRAKAGIVGVGGTKALMAAMEADLAPALPAPKGASLNPDEVDSSRARARETADQPDGSQR